MSQTRTTITVADKLDASQMDDVFRAVVGCGTARRGQRCLLDLSHLGFMTPAGLTGLIQCVMYLRSQGWSISLRFPGDGGVSQYLVRMGLKRALQGRARCLGAPVGRRRYAPSTALVELTTIQYSSDVEALLLDLTDRVAGILKEELSYSQGDVGNFSNVISELGRNIIDHSGSVGYVAAQRYTRSDHKRFALISVGDLGVGLRATLGQRYDVDEWSDVDVIARALLPAYSRHPGRGLGLTFVKKVCLEYRGNLHIRSGASRVYIRGRRVLPVDVGWFPGTQLAISLGQRLR